MRASLPVLQPRHEPMKAEASSFGAPLSLPVARAVPIASTTVTKITRSSPAVDL